MSGQRELEESVRRYNQEQERITNMEKEREKKAKRNYMIRKEWREWATLAVAITALGLSIFSIFWQAPLH